MAHISKYSKPLAAIFFTTALSLPIHSFFLNRASAATAPISEQPDSEAAPTQVGAGTKSEKEAEKVTAKEAEQGTEKNVEVTVDSNLYKGEIYKKGLGLKGPELHLVNQGRFAELADKLSTHSYSQANRETAWLAFSYLYLQKSTELNQLAQSFESANNANEINLTLVQAFAFLCDKKTELAEKKLQTVPAEAMNDAFVNYAFATLSGKQGKPQVAIAYTKRAIELAPDFAWGYRTIAFLQERWLNQIKEAKTNYAKALEIEPSLSEAATALIGLYLANNEYDQAIAVAQSVIAHDPHNAANYRQLADIYLKQWRLNEAAQQLKKAISLDTSNTQYHRLLAFIYRRQNNLEAAIAEQKVVIDYSNEKSADLVDLATLQLANNNSSAAMDSLKQSLDIDPQNMTAIAELTTLSVQLGKLDDLIAVLNQCAAKLPKNAAIKLRLADALVAAQQMDKAIELYKEAANLNPNDPEPHTRIAAILIMRKDYANAAKEYTRALNINSNSVPNLVALGACEAQMDDYLKAEAAMVTALALHQLTQPVDSTVPPTRVEIIRGLSALLFKEGRYADAASQFTALCEIDRDPATKNLNKFMSAQAMALRDLSKQSFKQLEDAYASLSAAEKNIQKINYIDTLLRGNRFDEALALLKESNSVESVANSINDAFYNICLSRAYLGTGDLTKAEEAARQAIAICDKEKSPHSDAYCQLAEVLYVKGDLSESEKNANIALGVNAKAFRAYVLLGKIAMKRHQSKLAIEVANKALGIDPYFIDAYLLLGAAQSAQGLNKDALTTYRKAADLYPGLLPAHESLLIVLKKLGTKEEINTETAAIDQLKSKQ